MKRVIYKGLLALTIAFGVTSCDKNPMEDIAMPTVGAVENDEYSKVSFEESGFGIQVPKLKGDAAAKTASEFIHMYSNNPQTLIISDDAGAQYTGSYDAGNISSLDPSSIILANGNRYTAISSNASNTSDEIVLGFLPYTSSASFDLEATATISLQGTLERGFLIVNAEDAEGGERVTGATVNGSALMGPDDQGDFYGYLNAGSYDVIATYTLDDVATPVSVTQEVVVGVAYTIELTLNPEPEAVIGSLVSTSTRTALESEIGSDGGRDINDDGDLLDSLERVVTSTTPTSDDEATGPAVITEAPWYIISDVDLSSSLEESTELAETTDVNEDGDMHDVIARSLAITTTIVGDDSTVVSVPGEWYVIEGGDYSSVQVEENPDTTDEGDVEDENGVDTLSDWAYTQAGLDDSNFESIAEYAFGVDAGAQGDITRTRVVVAVDALDETAPEGDLSQTRTITNSDHVAVDPLDVWVAGLTNQGGGDSVIVAGTAADAVFIFATVEYATLAEAQTAASDANPGVDITVSITSRVSTPQEQSYDDIYDLEVLTVNGDADVEGTVNGQTRQVNVRAKPSTDLAATNLDSILSYDVTNAPIVAASWASTGDLAAAGHGDVFTNTDYTDYSFALVGTFFGSNADITKPDGTVESTTTIAGDNDFSQTIAAAKARIIELSSNN